MNVIPNEAILVVPLSRVQESWLFWSVAVSLLGNDAVLIFKRNRMF